MSRVFTVLATGLAMHCVAPLEARQTPPPATPSPTAAPADIEIPFNPPLERPIRYRSTIVSNRTGTEQTAWSDYELVFSRRESGFRLQVRVVDAGSPAFTALIATATPAQREEAHRMMMAGVLQPFVLLLDAGGQIEGMEDADAYWENAVREGTQRASGRNEGPNDQAAIDFAGDLLREQSPSSRLTILTQYIAPVVDYGGTSFTLGETVTADLPGEGLVGPVTQQVSLRAERVENGRLFLSMRTAVSEEEMRRAATEYLRRMPVTGEGHNAEAGRASTIAAMREIRFERTSAGSYEIALETGLVQRLESTDRNVVISGEETHSIIQTLRIERLE